MVTRFPADTTGEMVVPIEDGRGVHVRFPQDITSAEWKRASDAICAHIARSERRRMAEPGDQAKPSGSAHQ